MPLPPPVARAVHDVVAGRTEGPLLLNRDGRRMDRACAARLLRHIADAAGVTKPITPHGLRRTYITSGLLSGVPLRDVQVAARHSDPKMTIRYDMLANQLDRHAAHRIAGFLASMAG